MGQLTVEGFLGEVDKVVVSGWEEVGHFSKRMMFCGGEEKYISQFRLNGKKNCVCLIFLATIIYTRLQLG